MQVKTFKADIRSDDQRKWFEHEREVFRRSTSGYECRFIYNLRDKTIYECVEIESYRMDTHSNVIGRHPELEKQEKYLLRLAFNTDMKYNGDYLYNHLNIAGLKKSELYTCQYARDYDEDIFDELSLQDIQNIEEYISYLKKIKAGEIDE